jgi:hypothetical protein
MPGQKPDWHIVVAIESNNRRRWHRIGAAWSKDVKDDETGETRKAISLTFDSLPIAGRALLVEPSKREPGAEG